MAFKLLAIACGLSFGCAASPGGLQSTGATNSAGMAGMRAAAGGVTGVTGAAGAQPSAAGAAGTSGAQPSAAGAASTGKLSFANDVYPKVIRSKCGACHNDAPSFGGLAFFPGGPEVAYMNLVNVPAGSSQPDFKCKDSGLVRVVPGDPEHSLMYLKLVNPPCGSRMPSGIAGMATPEQLELVRKWIADGAEP